ncbi:MAG: hypothetical protein MUP66_02425 [Candidatus Nanohaloarchaeota archaeon QJJ-5]|nr:hypothetical protein [Candidatus Nanohaloarchaeota archaeon QJJ-5]
MVEPERVLQTLEQKDKISLIEAEQGLLASYLESLKIQHTDDKQAFRQRYGKPFDTALEQAIKKEFKDTVYRKEQDAGDLSENVLEEACRVMDDRLKLEKWPDELAETHTDRCNEIIEKAEE